MSTAKDKFALAQILARRKQSASTTRRSVQKPSVLLDLGQVWCKVGYMGEPLPRHTVRSPYVGLSYKLRFGQLTDTETKTLKQTLKTFLRTVCYELLLVVPNESTVVVCENNLRRYIDSELLLDLLLVDFGFKTATTLPVLGCCMLSHGLTTGLVIDCGYSSIRVLPFISSCPYTGAWQEVLVGTQAIAKEMLASLEGAKEEDLPSLAQSADILATDEMAMLKLVEHTAVVMPREYDVHSSDVPGIEHNLSSTGSMQPVKVLIPGHLRAIAGDVVFGRGDADGRTLTEAILDSLQAARLLASLKEGLAAAERFGGAKKPSEIAIRQSIGASPAVPLCFAWVGASAIPSDVVNAKGVDLSRFTAGECDIYSTEALIG
ncbi:hypothetical protein SARC_01516 [Sphaeroforma arctica JP610]|uniref:Actin n=1 Tax=Sphaeroforma arctica JP610 TaxID=667725 RepID=A0A0L0GBC7_9EUKA|nr:hypothetical protein SARC_01516 [Sphaeroforma arctica JP610]KNC86322.1 hypothetical protein SARC_01516 [Sphaeroforma arctica JP610]|eukprot:XP_014160224.1 hypothetical protein SARC_01516 [Sphaeroforma arctica JP610]